MRSAVRVGVLTLAAVAVWGCSDSGEFARVVQISNDTAATLILQVCDSFGCNNLNDSVRPGQTITENVDIEENLYSLRVLKGDRTVAGCLDVTTKPLPTVPVPLSTLRRC